MMASRKGAAWSGLLSNFAATPFDFHGQHYASLEGFWQMMKYPEGPDDPRATFHGLRWNYTRDQVAQHYAPVIYQETNDPIKDLFTAFDFDGDWNGDNQSIRASSRGHHPLGDENGRTD